MLSDFSENYIRWIKPAADAAGVSKCIVHAGLPNHRSTRRCSICLDATQYSRDLALPYIFRVISGDFMSRNARRHMIVNQKNNIAYSRRSFSSKLSDSRFYFIFKSYTIFIINVVAENICDERVSVGVEKNNFILIQLFI